MRAHGVRPRVLAVFLVGILAVVAPVIVRSWMHVEPALIEVETLNGRIYSLTQSDLDRLPGFEREGEVQNQFGNWRDKGLYSGVRLLDLPGFDGDYVSIIAFASDGYRVEIDRWRIEDASYPMVLALTLDGLAAPDWEDGPRIVVLPDDGRVSNEEAGLSSAGSLWIKNVTRLILR